MERVQVLIDRLVEQKQRGEGAAQLLATVQWLQQELASLQQQPETASRKVAVILPAPAIRISEEQEPEQSIAETIAKAAPPEVAPPQKSVEQPAETATPVHSYNQRRPSITELLQEKGEQKEPPPPAPPKPAPQPFFDVPEETPTLLQHTPQEEKRLHKEINQIIHGQQRSLNDQLRQQKTEVAHRLQDAPIKDLRKAIGINDKFVFLKDLFNGDEAAYERSIKTINAFHVLQEAEYWMNRELKLRLGWNDTAETVQHFYQLVRRRFS